MNRCSSDDERAGRPIPASHVNLNSTGCALAEVVLGECPDGGVHVSDKMSVSEAFRLVTPNDDRPAQSGRIAPITSRPSGPHRDTMHHPTTRLPLAFVQARGPIYVLVMGRQGISFRSWAEMEAFRDAWTGLATGEVRVEKFWSEKEARCWLEEQGVVEAAASSVFGSSRSSVTGVAPPADPDITTRVALTPAEVAARAKGSDASLIELAVAVPGSRERNAAHVPATVGREALLLELDVPDRERVMANAELRLVDGAKGWPSFGFQLTLPGNVIFAEASNLTVTSPALRTAVTPRGRLVALYIEALGTDLGGLAVALRVNTMSIYNALKQHLDKWRVRNGLDSKKKPVPDYDLLVALDAVIKERGLAVRVMETAVAQAEFSGQVRQSAGK